MKKIILLILLCCLFSCTATKLKGEYCNSFNGGYDLSCITFHKNGKFNYQSSGDLGTYYTGKGNYTIKNNILRLNFEKDSVIYKSEVTIKDWSFRDEMETDSIHLIFKVYDGYNKNLPLPGVIIYQEFDDGNITNTHFVQSSGAVTIIKPLDYNTEVYKFSFPGYENIEIPITNNFTQEINVILKADQPNIISDKTTQYILKEVKDDSFLTSKGYLFKKQSD